MGGPKLQWSSIITAYTAIFLFGSSTCLKIVGISVPALVDVRHAVRLACSYDTGKDALFSVKWYKDDNEFYRYMPSHKPNVLTFAISGAQLNLVEGDDAPTCGRTKCSVTLDQLSLTGSGAYTCEISTEAPTFRTAMETRNMTVMVFPLEEPRIEGLRGAYTIGDVMDVTCRSAPSNPPSQLTLYLNNEELSPKQLFTATETVDNDQTVSLTRLKMILSKVHFRGRGAGILTIKCTAFLPSVTDSARTVEATATLISPQPLHNQKLEWPSSAGKSSYAAGVYLLLIASSAFARVLFN